MYLLNRVVYLNNKCIDLLVTVYMIIKGLNSQMYWEEKVKSMWSITAALSKVEAL